MALLHMNGGYLYEHKPSLFPGGEITEIEQALWTVFHRELNNRPKNK